MPISPNPEPVILLLGDTNEAEELTAILQARPDCRLLRVGDLAPVAVDQLTTVDGFAHLLQTQAIRLVINAANPYEAALSECAMAAAIAADRPILRVMRPAWQRDPLDSWIDVGAVSSAADICRWYGKRIMITLGESDLTPFAGNDRCHFIVRLPTMPATPPDLKHYDLIIGQGPFAWVDERRLMMEQQIDLLVSRNIGGLDSYAKIDVARDLAIPVVMISRPAQPLRASADSVAQALIWIDAWRQTEPS
jgi:precorrin-6A/cobalt-precorrin-6A reductase